VKQQERTCEERRGKGNTSLESGGVFSFFFFLLKKRSWGPKAVEEVEAVFFWFFWGGR
jgi:hypothetical protein